MSARPFEIDISNRQNAVPVDLRILREALIKGLQIEEISSAVLSVSIVDDAAIHALNRDHLQHDYPTDVISFQLEFCPGGVSESALHEVDDDAAETNEFAEEFHGDSDEVGFPEPAGAGVNERRAAGATIEGEIVASAEMAAAMAKDGRWSVQSELTLYVIHGMLHICGYDDLSVAEQNIMRERERTILGSLGLTAVYSDDSRD